ncbi:MULTISPECIES: glycosyltransferase [unclassified Francisella]|uniref:glycosyltransferase n=1 Tax=unclassified Francisella TaxID=2610885 RepID=UPI002E30BADB|nr:MULTISPECIES: glycosyltransferase [unclassified Francisella]MED7818614.1 glycosyltransferase [Francisella sp. 19S2-4]MED7829450.1 glycosyltransferase [Francisella sp. 19S2-10]
MKILVFLTTSFPAYGGEQFIENEINYLSKHYDRVFIINNKPLNNLCRDTPSNIYVESAYNKESKRSVVNILLSLFKFKKMLFSEILKVGISHKKIIKMISWIVNANSYHYAIKRIYQKYQISSNMKIDFYSYWGSPAALCLAKLKSDNNCFTFNRLHRYDIYEERQVDNYLPYRKYIYLNNHQFIICKSAEKYLLENYNFMNKSNISLSYLGTESIIKYKLSSNTYDFNVISCSYVTKVKRVDLIAKAIILLASRLKNIKIGWTHIGGGSCLKEVEKILKQKPNNLDVNLLGELSNTEVKEHYKNYGYDMFINLSESEGVPVSMMEAQSAFIPVFATNVGGVSDIVNNDNGWLVPKDISPEEVTDMLFHTITNPNCKDYLLSKANLSNKHWQKLFHAERNYPAFLDEVDRLSLRYD